ncbi:hypothetical protein VTH82DRAFT_2123 [Thermothelomyces myriococcoides]
MPFQTIPDQRRYAPLTPSPLNPNTHLDRSRDHRGQQRPQRPNRTPRPSLKDVHNNPSRIAQRYAALASDSPAQRLLRQKAAMAWQLSGAPQARRHQTHPGSQRSVRFEIGGELHHSRHHHHHQQQQQEQQQEQQQQQQRRRLQQSISDYSSTTPSTTPMTATTAATATSNSTAPTSTIVTATNDALAMPVLSADEERSKHSAAGTGSKSTNENKDAGDEDEDEANIGLLLLVKKPPTDTGVGVDTEQGGTSHFERYRDIPTVGGGGRGDEFGQPEERGNGEGGGDNDGAGNGAGGDASRDGGICPFRLPTSRRLSSTRFERPLLPLYAAVKPRTGRRRFGERDRYGTNTDRDGRVSRLRHVMLVVAVLFGLAMVRGLATAFHFSRIE